MELDERPAFFKVLVRDDFSHQLRIPRAFVKNFKGCVPRMCGLRDHCGKFWAVNIEKIKNRLVFLDGWQRFVKHHFLEVGDFLILTKDGVSIFDVTIYDRSFCEENVETAKSRIGNVVHRTTGNNVITEKRPAVDLVDELPIEPSSFNPDNPSFTIKFTRSTFYNLLQVLRTIKL